VTSFTAPWKVKVDMVVRSFAGGRALLFFLS
jgi:hypothetical protein